MKPFILEEMMKFDYCEIENGPAQTMDIYMGCRFDDEPEELYVIQMIVGKDGIVQVQKLLFNGMDCKYLFKAEENALIKDYIYETLQSTAYVDWFEGTLSI
jgi:hypothetical protein